MINFKLRQIGPLLGILIFTFISLALAAFLAVRMHRNASSNKNILNKDIDITRNIGSLSPEFKFHVLELIARGNLMHMQWDYNGGFSSDDERKLMFEKAFFQNTVLYFIYVNKYGQDNSDFVEQGFRRSAQELVLHNSFKSNLSQPFMAYSNGSFDGFSILIWKSNDLGDFYSEKFEINDEAEFTSFLYEYYAFLDIEEEMRDYIKQQTSMIGN